MHIATVQEDGLAGRKAGSKLTPVAWVAEADVSLANWTSAGRYLGTLCRCSQWWLGDWVRYGNARFGERYVRASKITGYGTQTLMNMVYVSARFEISRRRESLSWSHHETVASLEPSDQERWLDQALAERFSIADLRLELRHWRRAMQGEDGASGERQDDTMICPHCGNSVPLAPASRRRAVRGSA